MSADRNKITSYGNDLSFITLTIKDDRGVLVPEANNLIIFDVSYNAEIVVTDNGDPSDLVSFGSHSRKAFNGLALVIVRAKEGMKGLITITAKSDGLKTVKIIVMSK